MFPKINHFVMKETLGAAVFDLQTKKGLTFDSNDSLRHFQVLSVVEIERSK